MFHNFRNSKCSHIHLFFFHSPVLSQVLPKKVFTEFSVSFFSVDQQSARAHKYRVFVCVYVQFAVNTKWSGFEGKKLANERMNEQTCEIVSCPLPLRYVPTIDLMTYTLELAFLFRNAYNVSTSFNVTQSQQCCCCCLFSFFFSSSHACAGQIWDPTLIL